jgi:hypothetical protein
MAKFEAGASSAADLVSPAASCSGVPQPSRQMFAQVAQRKLSAADAARAAERDLKDIFGKWRRLGRI